ncbi:MAG: rhodanese-like domain-containing protein [Chloroflexota bacterium]
MKRLLFVLLIGAMTVVISACGTSTAQNISPQDYVAQYTDTGAEHILIDVRTAQEFNSGHIAGAINIPVDQIASRLSEIPADIPVVVYCRSGNRSAQATNILNQNDYSEIYDLGGIIQWQSAGYPIQ